jgi:deoxyribose-phosphate aldolase
MDIRRYIDHTVLKPGTLLADVEKLCEEAVQESFAAVCVPNYFVRQAKALTRDTGVKTATVIGFPFGYHCVESKMAESLKAIHDGADELDIVANLTAIKNNDWETVEAEIAALAPAIKRHHKTIKVIIESGILTDAEILACCALYRRYPVDFLKTSTGYAEQGATVAAVKLMRKNLPKTMHIKASGGIRDFAQALPLIEAGAERIGASASMNIVAGSLGQ